MYVSPNFKTKKAFKTAVAYGKQVSFYEPGLGGPCPDNGTITVEGPHSPQPHTWAARVELKDGKVVSIK